MGLVYVPTGTKIMVGFSFPRHPVVFSDNDEGMFNHLRNTCAMVKSRYIGDGHPNFNRNPYSGAL